MRKLYFLLLGAWLCLQYANAQKIWSGTQPIDWNSGNYLQLSADNFDSVQVADRLAFCLTYTGNVDYPQLALQNSSWTTMAGAGNTALNASTQEVDYGVTSQMLASLKSGGAVVTGTGFTLDSILLVKGNGGAGYDHSVWIGSVQMKDDWSVYAAIPTSSFSSAQVGQVLRIRYRDASASGQLSPRGSDWNMLPGVTASVPEGKYTQYAITTEMLTSLQSGGMIVCGTGFTLTAVDVIDSADLKPLTLSTPVVHNWVWENGEQPAIRVKVGNPYDTDMQVAVELQVNTDKGESYTNLTKTINVAAASEDSVEFTFDADPGFYRFTATANDELAGEYNFGVEPESISSPADAQSDFDDFWSKAKAELAAVDMNATLEKLDDKSTADRNVYLVTLQSVPDTAGKSPVVFRAYYAEPVAEGKYPTIVHYSGYDSGGYDPWCPSGSDLPGYCELVVSTRGQLINNRDPYTNTYGDWFQYNFGDKDTYYYRGAYMDVLRALDFVFSREKVDTTNVFAEGASQGGAFTYAAAALSSHKLNAIAPAIPFMGDFPDYFEIGQWPAYQAHQQQDSLGLSDAEMYAFLSYFDTKNLATRIATPVISTIGLQDNVCPPHTNIAPYNNLPEGVEKSISYNATLAHQTPSTWYSTYMEFFKNHLVATPTSISLPATTTEASSPTLRYNLTGQRVDADYKGIVIENGKKVLKK